MLDERPSRRNVLKSTAAVASVGVIGSLAGCGGGGDGTASPTDTGGDGTDGTGGDGTDGDGTDGTDGSDGSDGDGGSTPSGSANPAERLSAVPGGSNFLMYVDFHQMRTDPELQQLLNMGVQSGTGSGSLEEALQGQGMQDIAVGEIYDMMIFGTIPENDPMAGVSQAGGAVVWTGIGSSTVISAASASEAEFSQETYNGQTVLVSSEGTGSVGVVSEGVYAVGSEEVVRSAIDVAGGGQSAEGSSTAQQLTGTNQAPLRFAADLPTGTFESGQGSGAMQYTSEIQSLTGSMLYKSGGNIGFQLSATMPDSGVASEAKATLDQIKQQLIQQYEQSEGGEQLVQMLNNLTITQSEATVSASYEDTLEGLMQAFQTGAMMGGMGGGGGGMVTTPG